MKQKWNCFPFKLLIVEKNSEKFKFIDQSCIF